MDARREPLQTRTHADTYTQIHTPGFRVVSGSDNSLPRRPAQRASWPHPPQATWAESLCPALPTTSQPLAPPPLFWYQPEPFSGPQGIRQLPSPACYLSSSPTQALTPEAGGGDRKVLGDRSHTQVRSPHFPVLRGLESSQVVVRRSWSPGFWF